MNGPLLRPIIKTDRVLSATPQEEDPRPAIKFLESTDIYWCKKILEVQSLGLQIVLGFPKKLNTTNCQYRVGLWGVDLLKLVERQLAGFRTELRF